MNKDSRMLQIRKEKINSLKADGINLYPNDFKPSCSFETLKNIIKVRPDSLGEAGDQFELAGRMMAINKIWWFSHGLAENIILSLNLRIYFVVIKVAGNR